MAPQPVVGPQPGMSVAARAGMLVDDRGGMLVDDRGGMLGVDRVLVDGRSGRLPVAVRSISAGLANTVPIGSGSSTGTSSGGRSGN